MKHLLGLLLTVTCFTSAPGCGSRGSEGQPSPPQAPAATTTTTAPNPAEQGTPNGPDPGAQPPGPTAPSGETPTLRLVLVQDEPLLPSESARVQEIVQMMTSERLAVVSDPATSAERAAFEAVVANTTAVWPSNWTTFDLITVIRVLAPSRMASRATGEERRMSQGLSRVVALSQPSPGVFVPVLDGDFGQLSGLRLSENLGHLLASVVAGLNEPGAEAGHSVGHSGESQ